MRRGARERPDHPPDPHHDEPRHDEIFFDNLAVPAENLIGEEGQGFRYILDGMNAERILIAAECIGDAKWFIDQGHAPTPRTAQVFGRPIGAEPGRPVPDRQRLRPHARGRTDGARGGAPVTKPATTRGEEANMAKMLAADASWEAANVCVQTHGGFGFAEEYDIERKFRETRLYQVAPISTNLDPGLSGRARARPATVLLTAAVNGLADDGVTFSRTTYATDRASRKAAMRPIFLESEPIRLAL